MIEFVIKNRKSIGLVIILTAIYLALRLPSLTSQPIFADEAIYIRWAQIMQAEPTLRFVSLSDGKTPLFMWMMIPLFKFFPDPLFAGRFLSIMSGFITMLGVIFLGWTTFNRRIGFLAGLIAAITPYLVFFDRMALVDSMLAAFGVLSLNLAILLARFLRLDLAFILGYALGGAMLTKTPGILNILVLPISFLAVNFKTNQFKAKLVKLAGLMLVAVVTALAIFNILRLGPGFVTLSHRDKDYYFSISELAGRPLDPFIPHVRDLADWLPKMFTLPILVGVGFGVIYIIFKRHRFGLVIFLWAIIPLLVEMAFLKTFTTRYILSSIPPLLVLAGVSIEVIWRKIHLPKIVKLFSFAAVLLPLALRFDYILLTDTLHAPLPKESRRGYFEDWTAGYNLKQIADFLEKKAEDGTIVVGTEGSFGTLPNGLEIYLDKYFHSARKDHQIIILGGKGEITEQLKSSAKKQPTFFIANRMKNESLNGNLKLLQDYPKLPSGKGETGWILVYQVLPL